MFVHDVIYQKYEREWKGKWYRSVLLAYVKFTERAMFKYCDAIAVHSLKDKEILFNEYGVNATPLILKKRFAAVENLNTSINLSHFVFLGAWNRRENLAGLQWFIKNVYPLLDKEISFTILGDGLTGEFKRNLPRPMEAKGFVPNTSIYLQGTSALVAPLFLGAGVKFKVLDALSNGCRVIGTDISLEGVDIVMKDTLFRANDQYEFAKYIDYCSKQVYDPAEIQKSFNSYISRFTDIVDWAEQNIYHRKN